jgi:hypothetical protein
VHASFDFLKGEPVVGPGSLLAPRSTIVRSKKPPAQQQIGKAIFDERGLAASAEALARLG